MMRFGSVWGGKKKGDEKNSFAGNHERLRASLSLSFSLLSLVIV